MKIGFVIPEIKRLGGVALHYKGLQRFWKEDVCYFEQKTAIGDSVLHKIVIVLYNRGKFIWNIITKKPSHIILNISLKQGFYSQLFYWYICKFLGKKIGVFIHGWDTDTEDYYLKSDKCRRFLNGVNGIFVLSSQFKKTLHINQITTPIYLMTTKVDNTLLEQFHYYDKKFKNRRFLFVARLIKEKGIFESLQVFEKIQEKYNDATFSIVGDGTDFDNVKNYVQSRNLKGITLHGSLSGEDLIHEFENADYYFLITSWGEGLPGSLLEAMSFGLIPIVRGVGGIPDIFEDGNNGIMLMNSNVDEYVCRLFELMNDVDKAISISSTNYQLAQQQFLASVVAKKMENIIAQL